MSFINSILQEMTALPGMKGFSLQELQGNEWRTIDHFGEYLQSSGESALFEINQTKRIAVDGFVSSEASKYLIVATSLIRSHLELQDKLQELSERQNLLGSVNSLAFTWQLIEPHFPSESVGGKIISDSLLRMMEYSKRESSEKVRVELLILARSTATKILRLINLEAFVPRRIPEVEAPRAENLQVSSYLASDLSKSDIGRTSYIDHGQLLSLLSLMKSREPKTVFEFGTMRGSSAFHFFLNTLNDVHIHTLDIQHTYLSGELHRTLSESGRVTFHLSDSLSFDSSFLKGQMNFIFIDGGHRYEVVKNDTEKALGMCSKGATIVWDDYHPDNPDVMKYLHELYDQGYQLKLLAHTNLVYLDL